MSTYVTVAIPYVNAAPHLGYAYELVQADVYARARRLAGDDVRFLGGTDDYSLKNVLAAEAAGVPDADVRRRPRRRGSSSSPARSTCRSTTSSGRAPTPATDRRSNGCGAPAPPPATSTSATTRATTASAASSSTTGPTLPGGRCPEHGTAARAGRRGELVLPPLGVPGPARPPDRLRRAGRPPRAVPRPRCCRSSAAG